MIPFVLKKKYATSAIVKAYSNNQPSSNEFL